MADNGLIGGKPATKFQVMITKEDAEILWQLAELDDRNSLGAFVRARFIRPLCKSVRDAHGDIQVVDLDKFAETVASP